MFGRLYENFFIAKDPFIVWIVHIFLIQPSADGHVSSWTAGVGGF